VFVILNPFNPKYLEWYSPCLDLEHTIQVCRGERVKTIVLSLYTKTGTVFLYIYVDIIINVKTMIYRT